MGNFMANGLNAYSQMRNLHRMDQEQERQTNLDALNRERHDQNMELGNLRKQQLQQGIAMEEFGFERQKQAAEDMDFSTWAATRKPDWDNGGFNIEDAMRIAEYKRLDLENFAQPEFQQNFRIFDDVINRRKSPNDPDSIAAANNLWGGLVKKRLGEQLPDGRTIVDKRISAFYPSQKPGHIYIELDNTTDDGETYQAPVTANRGTGDDEDVLEVPIEDIVKYTAGLQMFGRAIDMAGLQGAIQGLRGNLNPRNQSASMREFQQRTSGLTPEEVDLANRIELGLEPRAVGSSTMTIANQEASDAVARSQGVIEKEKAKQKAIGKAEGESNSELSQTLATAEESLGLIDKVLNHPGLDDATGLSSRLNPANITPGTDAYDFNVLMKQLQGRAFLAAYESLKGGGQITEIEGLKAEQALARLDTAQSKDEFVAALNDLKDVIVLGMGRAKQKTGAVSSEIDDLVNQYAD